MSGSISKQEPQSATIDATVRSLISTIPVQSRTSVELSAGVVRQIGEAQEYQMTDLVGRCFLRVCFWVDVLTSWRKKYHAPTFVVTHEKSQMAPPIPVVGPTAVSAPVLNVGSTATAALPAMKSAGI